MLQLSFDTSPVEAQMVLSTNTEVFWILQNLVKIEIEAVKNDICMLAIGPDLQLKYAIAQQRLICLQDLEQFFKTLLEKHQATE